MEFNVKLAGVTQGNRQKLIEWVRSKSMQAISLVRDYENQFDPNAIAAYVSTPSGDMQLGFIPNRATCRYCDNKGKGHGFPAYEKPLKCPKCGNDRTDMIDDGTANKIAKYMDEGKFTKALVEHVIGGDAEKGKESSGILLRVFIDL